MIWNRERRTHFTIFIFLSDVNKGTEFKASLSSAGYDTYLISDHDGLLERVRQAPPHVILFHVDDLATPMKDFVQSVVELNPEVLFLPLAPLSQAKELDAYREYNFPTMLVEGEELGPRAVWCADEICKQLYLTYQNEQLLTQLEVARTSFANESTVVAAAPSFQVAASLKPYQNAQTKEDLIQGFLNQLQDKMRLKGLYLKYLPTVQSLVLMQSVGLDIESVKGIGVRLTEDEGRDFLGFLNSGKLPSAMRDFMADGLKVSSFQARPLMASSHIDGLFAFWSSEPNFDFQNIENDFLLLSLVFDRFHLKKRNEMLDQMDPVTDLPTRDFYLKRLNEEVARARRLQRAVSLVKVSLDHYVELEQSLGRSNRDLIVRTIASLIRKTSRVNDIACRTSDNELSLILPHCARKGGTLRVERLRRMVENHAFTISGVRVTIAGGVSEYPSLSSSAIDLENSASQALEYIVKKGGNKVCLYRPVENFRPDYDVPPI